MDHTSDMEQDIVADSEGEEEPLQLQSLGSPVLNVYNSPLILSPKRPPKDDVSSVSDFTRGTSNKDDISAFTVTPQHAQKPRPKPRPTATTKNKATPLSDIQDGSSFTSGDAAFPGILGIADRAKMRSRRVTQAKPKADIIDISSDDELSMPSSALNDTSTSKPRPTPKPRRSVAGTTKTSSSSSHSPPRPGHSHAPGPSSHVQHPTIAVLPEPNTSIDLTSPLSSPLPLPKKRKRPSVVEDDDIPGLPFFASSSADSPACPPQALPAKEPKKKAQKRNQDDEEFGSGPVKAPKPRKRNKDDEEFGDPQSPKPKKKRKTKDKPPTARTAKPKEPAIIKSREFVGDDDDLHDFLMDAAGHSGKERGDRLPDTSSSDPLTKKKEKAKPRKTKAKEPEVFKSREFIEADNEDEPAQSKGSLENSGTGNAPVEDIPSTEPIQRAEPVVATPSTVSSDAPDASSSSKSKPTKKRKSGAMEDATEGGGNSKKKKTSDKSKQETSGKKAKGKGKVVLSDEELEEPRGGQTPTSAKSKRKGKVVLTEDEADMEKQDDPPPIESSREKSPSPSLVPKENIIPRPQSSKPSDQDDSAPPKPKPPTLVSRYSIAPRHKPTPMSELIRRVNSHPSSPFPTPRAEATVRGTAYSPYMKSSKSALSRIAPLHPNRKPPPPPLPPPPPRQKTKKEKEMEEQWEEELVESVGGMTEWLAMSDLERKEMRRAKREREMGGWED